MSVQELSVGELQRVWRSRVCAWARRRWRDCLVYQDVEECWNDALVMYWRHRTFEHERIRSDGSFLFGAMRLAVRSHLQTRNMPRRGGGEVKHFPIDDHLRWLITPEIHAGTDTGGLLRGNLRSRRNLETLEICKRVVDFDRVIPKGGKPLPIAAVMELSGWSYDVAVQRISELRKSIRLSAGERRVA